MTLDDRSLREHLERRADAGNLDVSALTEAVLAGATRRRQISRWRRLDSRFVGIGIAAAVAVAMLGAAIVVPPRLWPSPGTSADASLGVSPDASPRATAGDLAGYPANRALTTDELFAAVLDQPQAQVGTLLIADVEIHVLGTSCVPGASACGLYFVRTPARVASLHVIGTNRPQGRATYAFRVASGPELEFVGSVDPGPDRFAWTMPRLTDALATSNELVSHGRLVLADGWLGSLNGSQIGRAHV